MKNTTANATACPRLAGRSTTRRRLTLPVGTVHDLQLAGDDNAPITHLVLATKAAQSLGAHAPLRARQNAEGGFGSDKLVGNAASNVLRGSTGNDRLYGLGADDVLDGQQGANSADGGPGSDACRAQVQVNCER